jgi:hypothetical protein
MFRPRPTLGVAVVLIAAAVTCASSLGQLLYLGPDYRHADVLADYDGRRFNALRPLLTAGSTVEYVEDLPPGSVQDFGYGYATQYALCPAVVVLNRKPQAQILLNGRPDSEPADLGRLVLELDAGNGVRLYRAGEP